MAGLYEVLGLLPTATEEDIRTAFRQRARELHPDKGGTTQAYHWARMAMETLTNATRRMRYDIHLAWAREARAARAEAARQRRAAARQWSTKALFQRVDFIDGDAGGLVGENGIFPKRGLRAPTRYTTSKLEQAAKSFAELVVWANEIGPSVDDGAGDPAVADSCQAVLVTRSDDELGMVSCSAVEGISKSEREQAASFSARRTVICATPISHIGTQLVGLACDAVQFVRKDVSSAGAMATFATHGRPSITVEDVRVDVGAWPVNRPMLLAHRGRSEPVRVANTHAGVCLGKSQQNSMLFYIYRYGGQLARASQQQALTVTAAIGTAAMWPGAHSMFGYPVVTRAWDAAVTGDGIASMVGNRYRRYSLSLGEQFAPIHICILDTSGHDAALPWFVTGNHVSDAVFLGANVHTSQDPGIASGPRCCSPSNDIRLHILSSDRMDGAVVTIGPRLSIEDICEDVAEAEEEDASGCFATCWSCLWSMMFWGRGRE